MNYTLEDVQNYSQGDIIRLQGKSYRLTKKTTTAIAISRYYWFDRVIDWAGSKIFAQSERS